MAGQSEAFAGRLRMSSETSELIARARRGDRRAFEELYRWYYPPVVRRLSHLVGPSSAVHDLVQETFLRAYRALDRYRGEAPMGSWLLRIATNVAREHYRRSHRRLWALWGRPEQQEQAASSATLPDDSYPTLQAVHAALQSLSPTLREAVVLRELEELSLAEMAATLEIPLHTAASRVRRGREKLRRALERMGCQPGLIGERAALLCGSDR